MLRKKRTSRSALWYSALAGAAAVALVLIPSASSADTDPLLVGLTTTATLQTTLSTTSSIGLEVVDSTPGANALFGYVSAATSGGVGVRGESNSTGSAAAGVWGLLDPATPGLGGAAGVRGYSASTTANGPGVYGIHGQNTGTAPGVLGETNSNADLGAGVVGNNNGSSTLSTGVLGNASNGIGLLGIGGTAGVLGYNPNAGGLAGYFVGDVAVTGTLTKGAGAFRIDHPLDPAHKYLQHSFVESPQMMNVYNGNATTNGKGFATVKLPTYFQALNRSFRYQLTVLGHAPWSTQARVWDEIAHNRFTIRTNRPSIKVSWQVTGVRHDPYANAHRIPVELAKPPADQGKYLHPELYGKASSQSVVPKIATKALAQAHR